MYCDLCQIDHYDSHCPILDEDAETDFIADQLESMDEEYDG